MGVFASLGYVLEVERVRGIVLLDVSILRERKGGGTNDQASLFHFVVISLETSYYCNHTNMATLCKRDVSV